MFFGRIVLKGVVTLAVLFVPAFSYAGDDFSQRLADAAVERTTHKIIYDGSYVSMKYPNGDVAANVGVSADVVIRSYRKVGVDLQYLIHEDMEKHFSLYPSKRIWGLTRTDKNIDHRRVPNQRVFFARFGTSLPVTKHADDYKAGDIVSWKLKSGRPYIAIVISRNNPKTGQPLLVYNMGDGPQIKDALFVYKITGHYRYNPNATHALKEMHISNKAHVVNKTHPHKKVAVPKEVLSKIVEIQ